MEVVTIKSPIPVNPQNVSNLPPIAVPKRAISVIPLVISAAFVLSPYPNPSGILIGKGYSMEESMKEVKMVVEGVYSAKAAIGLIYTRNASFIKIFCKYSAVAFSCAPTTIVVGIPRPTSNCPEI